MKIKKLRFRLSSMIFVVIIAAIWNLLVFMLSNPDNREFLFWGGYTFAMIAFVITAAMTALAPGDKDASISSRTPALLYTGVYFIVSLILNTIFVIISKGENRLVVVLPNIIILLIYAAAMVFIFYASGRIAQNDKELYGGAAMLDGLAIQITGMADLSENAEVKAELKVLCQAVEYSNIIGNAETKELESRFRMQVIEIQTMIDEEEEPEAILKKIKSAKVTLKTRTTMLSVSK